MRKKVILLFSILSPGGWIICGLAIISTIIMFSLPIKKQDGLLFWVFARNHKQMYDPITEEWNAQQTNINNTVNILLLSGGALQRRLMSGFLSGTPLPDLVEVYSSIASQTFKGRREDIGFADLTDRLEQEGILDEINAPSFSPWTSHGRIYGLPHDVHPVLLGYRADIIEAAGIDMSKIDTWDDFVRILKSLVKDTDGDGYIDHYLLNIWETNPELIEMLMLQAGGGFFDGNQKLIMSSDINARVLATVISWTTGPDRVAVNAPEFDAAGNRMRIDGQVLCSFLPDWLSGVWMLDLPQLKGKIKLMPLPTWEKGGDRTSVMGGTMLGIPKTTKNFEQAWAYAKHLYLTRELAHKLYKTAGIVTPVKKFWNDPVFDEPNPFFCGQANGRLYINEAPNVPIRTSSPYNSLAVTKIGDCAMSLKGYAAHNKKFTVEELLPEAGRLLKAAQDNVQQQMDRNVFIAGEEN